MRIHPILLALMLCLFAYASASAEDADPPAATYRVVASPGIGLETVSSEDLRKLYLGHADRVGDVAVSPLLRDGGDAHRAFLLEVVEKSETGFRLYWRKQIFSGNGQPPPAFADDAQVVAQLRALGNGIAYVSPTTDTADLVLLEVLK